MCLSICWQGGRSTFDHYLWWHWSDTSHMWPPAPAPLRHFQPCSLGYPPWPLPIWGQSAWPNPSPKHVQTCSLPNALGPPPPTQTSVAKHAVGIRLISLLVSISSSKCVVRYNKVIIFETVYNDFLGWMAIEKLVKLLNSEFHRVISTVVCKYLHAYSGYKN